LEPFAKDPNPRLLNQLYCRPAQSNRLVLRLNQSNNRRWRTGIENDTYLAMEKHVLNRTKFDRSSKNIGHALVVVMLLWIVRTTNVNFFGWQGGL
jgi:hypothetical protein